MKLQILFLCILIIFNNYVEGKLKTDKKEHKNKITGKSDENCELGEKKYKHPDPGNSPDTVYTYHFEEPESKPQPIPQVAAPGQCHCDCHCPCEDQNTQRQPPRRNALIVVGPSGSGKTTLTNLLAEDLSGQSYMLLRHTSRPSRPTEVDGVDYHFVQRQELMQGLKDGRFISISEMAGNIYGISKKALSECIKVTMKKGKLCMTEMMIQPMVLDALKMVPELNAVYVFINPPDLDTLEDRLRNRQTEDETTLRDRLHKAREDSRFCEEKRDMVDYCLTNIDIERSFQRLKEIVKTEFPFIHFKSGDPFAPDPSVDLGTTSDIKEGLHAEFLEERAKRFNDAEENNSATADKR